MSSWEELVVVVKKTCLEMFGEEPERVCIKTKGGLTIDFPLPVQSPEDSPWHSPDFREVSWPSLGRFRLTIKQSIIVGLLWKAWEEQGPDISQKDLLEAADSDCVRLVDLFRKSPAWQRLILSTRPGRYHLPGNISNN